MKKLNILMVTGVYLPEFNGAVLQCNQIVKSLSESFNFTILSGTNDALFKGSDCIEGINVYRAFMPKYNKFNFLIGAFHFYKFILNSLNEIDLIHIHGYSKRNSIIILIGFLFRKKIIIKMTSIGIDDPVSIKNKSYLLWKIFSLCDAYICISPAFLNSYKKTYMSKHKVNFIPNGVDINRFFKVKLSEKKQLRIQYGFTENDKIIIFVGHFSNEKNPMLVYESCVKLCELNTCIKLLFIGRTRNHFEVNENIYKSISADAKKRNIFSQINFVEETKNVDIYMKIADVFVLPSSREGLPNALLEAMACSLHCVVSCLPGITDWLIEDEITGLLLKSDDTDILTKKIEFCISKNKEYTGLGDAARSFIEKNFTIKKTSDEILNLYQKFLSSKHLSN